MYYCTPAVQTGSYSRPMPSVVGYNNTDEVASIHLPLRDNIGGLCNMSSLSMSAKIRHNKQMLSIRTLLHDNIHRSLAKSRNLSIQIKR